MSLPALLLHQYDTSPFSEKIRKIFAHKRLAWGAVEQPSIMPKPELVPLTGGYRRIPVLQIGADVYCDTQLIVARARAPAPEPTIYPGGERGHLPRVEPVGRSPALHAGGRPSSSPTIGQFVPQGVHRRPHEDDAGAQLRRHSQARAARARAGARAARDRRGAARRRPAVAARRRVQPGRRRLLPSDVVPARRRRRPGAAARSSRGSAPGWRRSRRWARATAAMSRPPTRWRSRARHASRRRRPAPTRRAERSRRRMERVASRPTTTASTRSPARWWRRRSTRSRSVGATRRSVRSWSTSRASGSASRGKL